MVPSGRNMAKSWNVWALRGVVEELVLAKMPIDEALTQTIERNVPLAERHEALEALRVLLRQEARAEEDPEDRLVFPDRTQLSLPL